MCYTRFSARERLAPAVAFALLDAVRAVLSGLPCGTPCGMARAPGRRCLTTWISGQGYDLLRQRADAEENGNLSALVRRMLRYASVNMPKGWK